jgi:hypothetical protein
MRLIEIFSRLRDVSQHALLYTFRSINRYDYEHQHIINNYELNNLFQYKDTIESLHETEQEKIVTIAQNWINHRGRLFELSDILLDDPIAWHRDYSSSIVSPVKYSGFINHRDATQIGDVKYIWELNRLQHLVLLALAVMWTKNDIYIEEIEKHMFSWCLQNPFMRGINWKSPLEVGIRLISWAFVAFLTQGSKRMEKFFQQTLRETIYQHQVFIRKFFSKHSSANNHLIGEMAGLYVATVWWPWYRESQVWRRFAKRKLVEEISRQVNDDGVGKELATEYQLFILEFFLLTGTLGQAIGDPFPSIYWQQIRSMCKFLHAISDRHGNLPMFGDGDSGQVVGLPESPWERIHIFARMRYKSPGYVDRKETRARLLFWGQMPYEIPFPQEPQYIPDLQIFPQGGYCALAADRSSEQEMLIVFDVGLLGLPPLYAHGHSDALSFWLSYGGCEFLIDPGTFSYYTHEVWRAYFRSTAAHNTIRIDGEDQSIPGGRFLWRSVAHCGISHFEDTKECILVKGYHDGYKRLPDPVTHWREIRLYKKLRTMVITDRLECYGTHHIEIFFHFSEACQVRQLGLASFEALSGTKRIQIDLDSRLVSALYKGAEEPILGWISRVFGDKTPTFTLVGRAHIAGDTQLQTKIEAH